MTGPGWPDARGWLVIVTTGLLVYVLTLLAFRPDLEKSQLFVALASGVVGASFIAVIGMWTASTKAGADMAQRAMEKLPDSRDIQTKPATGKPDDPVHTVEEARP